MISTRKQVWKNGLWSLVVCACAVYVMLWALPGNAQDILKIKVANDPWPPYAIGELDKTPTGGMIVNLVYEIFKRLNIEVEFTLYPWNRVLKLAQDGEIDCIAFAGKNAEREAWLGFTDVVYIDRQLIYYRADRAQPFEWNTYEDLKGFSIGLTSGFNYGDELPKAIDTLKLDVSYAKYDDQGFEKLLRGRMDLFICAEPAAEAIFKKNPAFQGQFKTAAKPHIEHLSYIAFPKKVPAVKLIPEVDRVLAEIRADGTYDKIMNQSE